jgi:hypothetical protein
MSKSLLARAGDKYWRVGPKKQVFSSRRAAFVEPDDVEFQTFAERFEVPAIASKAELADVLEQAGVEGGAELPQPAGDADASRPPAILRRLRDLETRTSALESAAKN